MAVEVLGVSGESNGYGDSMDAFRNAHRDNSRIILNLAHGRKKNHPDIPYDPAHPDNQWPVMLYHAEKGHKVFGSPLAGLEGANRKAIEQENRESVAAAKKDGWRNEPYRKPQIAVLDPAVEKAALQAKIQEQDGKLVAQGDSIAKLTELVEKLLKSQK